MVNLHGQVVGWESIGAEEHAILWQNGVTTDLGSLGGTPREALAINERGQIVGFSRTANGDQHAFLWQNGVMTDLGSPGGRSAVARAIMDDGTVIGSSGFATATGPVGMVAWHDGVARELVPEFFALLINHQGDMVGLHWRTMPAGQFLIWQHGHLRPTGIRSAELVAFNDSDQLLIKLQQMVGGQHAYLWQNGTISDLGGPAHTDARAFNEHDQIVGSVNGHVALWTRRHGG